MGVVDGTKTMTVGEDDMPQLYQPLAPITNDRRRVQFVLQSCTPTGAADARVLGRAPDAGDRHPPGDWRDEVDISRMVLRDAVTMVIVGSAVGVAIALMMMR